MTTAVIALPRTRHIALGGGAVFLAGAALVHGGNYAFNVVLGRLLGPARFSELSLIVTFMLVLTFAATTVQTTAARFVAMSGDPESTARLQSWLVRSVRPAGLALGLLLAVAAPGLASLFRLSSATPLLLLAAGVPFFLAQAVHRGVVQGTERFGMLAGSYQAEMWVRLLGGVALVAAGFSVAGAAAALPLSFAAGWLVVCRRRPRVMDPAPALRRRVRAFAGSSVVLLAGEMLICHGDMIIAKLTLDPATAGAYAAAAVIGRLAYFGTWPVVALIIPIAARRSAAGEPAGRVLAAAVALVGGVSVLLTVAAVAVPDRLLELAFGPENGAAAPWLAPYLAALGCFAVARTVFSYHLARGRRTGAVLALGGGLVELAVLSLIPTSAASLVWAQLVLMAGLLTVAAVWHLRARNHVT